MKRRKTHFSCSITVETLKRKEKKESALQLGVTNIVCRVETLCVVGLMRVKDSGKP